MLHEKRRPWHRLVFDKLGVIVAIPRKLMHTVGFALLDTSRSSSVATSSRDSASASGGAHIRHVIRSLFYYPEAHTQLRPTAWLDGLRGVAALEVMIYHYHLQILYMEYNPAYGSREDTMQWWRLPFIKNFFTSGHTMVNVFFLISGFVLTQRSLSLIRSRQYDKLYTSVSSAIFRRCIRIYLPSVIVSFVGMILCYLKVKQMQYAPPQEHLYQQFFDWISASIEWVNPFHNYYNGRQILHRYEHNMWTLPLEIYGSFVCYAVVMAVARITNPIKRTFIIMLLAGFAFAHQNWWTANFLIGMLHADFMLWQAKTSSSWSTSVTAKCFWSILFIWAFYVSGLPDPHYDGEDGYKLPGFDWYYEHIPSGWEQVEGGSRFWWMLSGCSMTVAISQLPLLRKIFERRICQYLGRVSFMLYLVHVYVYEIIGGPIRRMLMEMVEHEHVYVKKIDKTITETRGMGTYIAYLGFWVCILPVVFVVAGQVTRYVDDPSIRFAKWLETKFTEDDGKQVTPIPIYARVNTDIS